VEGAVAHSKVLSRHSHKEIV